MQRVREGGKFPCPEVSGEKENAFAAGVGALKIFEAIVDDDLRNIFARVPGEKADFGELAAEGDKFSAQQFAAFARAAFPETRGSDFAGRPGARRP